MKKLLLRGAVILAVLGAAASFNTPKCRGDDCNQCHAECSSPATKTCVPAIGTKKCVCEGGSCSTEDCESESDG